MATTEVGSSSQANEERPMGVVARLAFFENKDIFGSVFKVLVGKDQEPMWIHADILAGMSPALRSLVKGPMEDAQKQCTSWDDVEKETFTMFAQFAYTGDYMPLQPSDRNRLAAPETASSQGMTTSSAELYNQLTVTETENLLLRSGAFAEGAKENKRARKDRPTALKKMAMKRKFHELDFPAQAPSLVAQICRPRGPTTSTQDFLPVFLGHARLYVLADKYGIDNLKTTVLHKLHRTLCTYSLFPGRYGEVVELVRYTYDHTPLRKSMDPLRRLVATYIASAGREIPHSEPCTSFIADCPDFALDLLLMKLEEEK